MRDTPSTLTMKTINFSKIEILPSLLDKSKTQTIRPAWKSVEIKAEKKGTAETEPCAFIAVKLPTHKVGDKVKLMWTGSNTDLQKARGFGTIGRELGTAKITEVFKIEIVRQKSDFLAYRIMSFGIPIKPNSKFKIADLHWCKNCKGVQEIEYLAKRDGFKSAEQMFSLLDKMYDLSTPKQFYVYRW